MDSASWGYQLRRLIVRAKHKLEAQITAFWEEKTYGFMVGSDVSEQLTAYLKNVEKRPL
jgi:hypothetical protein